MVLNAVELSRFFRPCWEMAHFRTPSAFEERAKRLRGWLDQIGVDQYVTGSVFSVGQHPSIFPNEQAGWFSTIGQELTGLGATPLPPANRKALVYLSDIQGGFTPISHMFPVVATATEGESLRLEWAGRKMLPARYRQELRVNFTFRDAQLNQDLLPQFRLSLIAQGHIRMQDLAITADPYPPPNPVLMGEGSPAATSAQLIRVLIGPAIDRLDAVLDEGFDTGLSMAVAMATTRLQEAIGLDVDSSESFLVGTPPVIGVDPWILGALQVHQDGSLLSVEPREVHL